MKATILVLWFLPCLCLKACRRRAGGGGEEGEDSRRRREGEEEEGGSSPCLCLRQRCAILMPEMNLMSPVGSTWLSLARILPVSVVRVTSTERSAIVIRATLDSGLDLVLEWVIRLTASCWACSLVGLKSPFLMNWELSIQMIVDSRTILARSAALLRSDIKLFKL